MNGQMNGITNEGKKKWMDRWMKNTMEENERKGD